LPTNGFTKIAPSNSMKELQLLINQIKQKAVLAKPKLLLFLLTTNIKK